MNPTSPLRHALGGRAARNLTPAVLAVSIIAGTAACGGTGTSSQGTARSTRTVSPEPAMTGSASASPRSQQEFAASVSAAAERNRQQAAKQLTGVKGRGNAVTDVSVTGLPVAKSEQFRSALVRVTNRTDKAAFYAVKVEFVDSSGKVLDSVVLGFADVPPGGTVSQHANSRKAAGVKTFPRIAQAERS
ncbi:hypothetical protein [Streptomyces sp. Ncost-T10-10d]|uniref:hypothetical protein n=1 Tax=Streptomyces sp. Ncost-T10-10d TaxID=1839774 RepID=UPI00081EE178|nr:hypothetical protein [Streptomyces sp. Ncost-T10-10d]SCF78456.1 hypothetical protein GA0115254_116924 [Streptomyces sp. Ncost-T10-10d]